MQHILQLITNDDRANSQDGLGVPVAQRFYRPAYSGMVLAWACSAWSDNPKSGDN